MFNLGNLKQQQQKYAIAIPLKNWDRATEGCTKESNL